eukprot:3280080-Amphidinium_carterae.1
MQIWRLFGRVNSEFCCVAAPLPHTWSCDHARRIEDAEALMRSNDEKPIPSRDANLARLKSGHGGNVSFAIWSAPTPSPSPRPKPCTAHLDPT